MNCGFKKSKARILGEISFYAILGSVCSFSFLYWCSRHMATKPIIARGRKTINADIMIICMVYLFLVRRLPHSLIGVSVTRRHYSLFSTVLSSFVVHKRPKMNVMKANAKPLKIMIACGNSPCKIPAMNIPAKTSLPMSSISFPMFSLKFVCFLGLFSFPMPIL